jgi:hypothetical protein
MHQNVTTDHGVFVRSQKAREEEIPSLAYKLWQDRGCPDGSPQEDWFRAIEELQSHH